MEGLFENEGWPMNNLNWFLESDEVSVKRGVTRLVSLSFFTTEKEDLKFKNTACSWMSSVL